MPPRSRSPRTPTRRYLDRMTELLGDSLFTVGNCATSRSYYFNPSGEATLLRPMSTQHARSRRHRVPVERLPDRLIGEAIQCFSSKKNSRTAQIAGLAVAGIGLSHFSSPQLFESITKAAFPRNTRQHIYINGGIETALGLGLALAEDPAAGRRRNDRIRGLFGRQRRAQPVAAQQRQVQQRCHGGARLRDCGSASTGPDRSPMTSRRERRSAPVRRPRRTDRHHQIHPGLDRGRAACSAGSADRRRTC